MASKAKIAWICFFSLLVFLGFVNYVLRLNKRSDVKRDIKAGFTIFAGLILLAWIHSTVLDIAMALIGYLNRFLIRHNVVILINPRYINLPLLLWSKKQAILTAWITFYVFLDGFHHLFEIVTKGNESLDGITRNYAFFNSGAIITKYSPPYKVFTLFYQTGLTTDPHSILKAHEKSECYIMKNNYGFITVQLTEAIYLKYVNLEITKNDELMDYIPKEVVLVGRRGVETSFLGFYEINQKQTLQTLYAKDTQGTVLTELTLHFLSNHGSTEATIICQIQVFGKGE